MSCPWLLDPAFVPYDREVLCEEAIWRLGNAVEWLAQQDEPWLSRIVEEIRSKRRQEVFDEWQIAVAREILFLHASHPELAGKLTVSFKAVKPWPDGPKLSEMLSAAVNVSAAVFPLDDKSSENGAAAQLWLVKGLSSTHQPIPPLKDGDAVGWMKRHDLLLLVVLPPGRAEATGESWQLAAELAACALDERSAFLPLVRDWVATGRVLQEPSGRRVVLHVDLGNKRTLASQLPSRRWLLPTALEYEIRVETEENRRFREGTRGRLHYALDVASAWSQIRGSGLVAGEKSTWAELRSKRAVVMHAFVSAALAPLLGATLLFQPERLVLWVTPQMKSNGLADKIRALFAKARDLGLLRQDCHIEPDAEKDGMCPQRATEVDAVLRAHETLRPDYPDPVVFCSTGGTYVMRIAPHELAREQSQLLIIYRPENPDPVESLAFSLFHYPGLHLTEIPLLPDLLMDAERSVMDQLFKTSPAKNVDLVERLRELRAARSSGSVGENTHHERES